MNQEKVMEYFESEPKHIIDVVATDDYSLIVTFNNNERRIFEMKDKLFGVFEFLKDINNFKKVFIDSLGNIAWDKDPNIDSNIVWNNRVDICKDSIYLNSSLYTD